MVGECDEWHDALLAYNCIRSYSNPVHVFLCCGSAKLCILLPRECEMLVLVPHFSESCPHLRRKHTTWDDWSDVLRSKCKMNTVQTLLRCFRYP